MQTEICLNKAKNVYFIGIGGISMSGLAKILKNKGINVAGSDCTKTDITTDLENEGIVVNYTQVKNNIIDIYDFVVYTPAISNDNEELLRVKELNIPLVNRSELLGYIMKLYDTTISIAGTHGKTTTTSLISDILLKAKYDPTISVGGILPSINSNLRIGNSQYFVTEACEYKDSFLDFTSKIEVILNIEEDHLDYFKDIDDIRWSFSKFINKIESGILVINSEIERYKELISNNNIKLITFGKEEGNYRFSDVINKGNFTKFKCYCEFDKKYYDVEIPIKGDHNIYNTLAAIAVCRELGIDINDIISLLKSFTGPKRRFEQRGVLKGNILVVDDYAHHPSEIEASLKTAKSYGKKNVVCVFQPHTYTRTKALFNDFVKALSLADKIILAEIYPAREVDTLGMNSKLIADELIKFGKEAYYFETFDEIENYLLMSLEPEEMCITMGAGDIFKVADKLI